MKVEAENFGKLTLGTLAGGALEEQFQVELERVLRNIDDPNTRDGERSITIKVTFKPNKNRTGAEVLAAASSRVAPDAPVETSVYLGREGSRPAAWEHNPEQLRIEFGEDQIREATKKIGGEK